MKSVNPPALCQAIFDACCVTGADGETCVFAFSTPRSTQAEAPELTYRIEVKCPNGLSLSWFCRLLDEIVKRTAGYNADVGCFSIQDGYASIPITFTRER